MCICSSRRTLGGTKMGQKQRMWVELGDLCKGCSSRALGGSSVGQSLQMLPEEATWKFFSGPELMDVHGIAGRVQMLH